MRYKSRESISYENKPLVFFTSYPDDFTEYFEQVSDDILGMKNCTVCYYDPADKVSDSEMESDLMKMQLIVISVTERLTETSDSVSDFIAHAKERHIPVLLMLQEFFLRQQISEEFGDVKCISTIGRDKYYTQLNEYLSKILIDETLIDEIRDEVSKPANEDTHHVFLEGLAHLAGIGVDVNRSRGAKLVMEAASKNDFDAMKKLSLMYETGDGVEADPDLSFYWLKQPFYILKNKYEETLDISTGMNACETLKYAELKIMTSGLIPASISPFNELIIFLEQMQKDYPDRHDLRIKEIMTMVEIGNAKLNAGAEYEAIRIFENAENLGNVWLCKYNMPEYYLSVFLSKIGYFNAVKRISGYKKMSYHLLQKCQEFIDEVLEKKIDQSREARNQMIDEMMQNYEKYVIDLRLDLAGGFFGSPDPEKKDIAIECINKVVELKQLKAKDLESQEAIIKEVADAYDKAGWYLSGIDANHEAREYYQKYVSFMEENNRVFNDPQSSINHATGYFHLGKEAVEEDPVQAEEYFTKGISILCTIADQLSDGKLLNDAWFSFLMVNEAYNEHGDVLMYEKFLYKKVKFIKKLFAKDKKEQYLEELFNAFDNLCRNEEKKNNKEKALFWCKELLACCFKLLKIEKTYMSIKYYRFAYNKLEELEKNKG